VARWKLALPTSLAELPNYFSRHRFEADYRAQSDHSAPTGDGAGKAQVPLRYIA